MSPAPSWVKHHSSTKEASPWARRRVVTNSARSVITAGQRKLNGVDVFRQKITGKNLEHIYGK